MNSFINKIKDIYESIESFWVYDVPIVIQAMIITQADINCVSHCSSAFINETISFRNHPTIINTID